MKIARWTSCMMLAAVLCAASSVQAQRGAGGAGAAAMPRGGGGWVSSGTRGGNWSGGGNWHGGWRHGGHSHRWYGASVGIYLGPGIYWGWPYAYDPWPYYDAYGYPYSYAYVYPNVTYAYPNNPAYYMEAAPDMAPDPPSFRYYCSDPKGYYPQVTNCTQTWLRVLPEDPQPADDASGVPGAPPSVK